MSTAFITGITGQDGSYLADLLLEKGYKVFGMKRRTSANDLGCSKHLAGKIEIVEGDLSDLSSLSRLVKSIKPEEFYNLAAQSHVGTSFEQPVYTLEATGLGVVNCLEAIRLSGVHSRFLQASTSEMFGGAIGDKPTDEGTPFDPRSPYAAAKMYGYWIARTYRQAYGMFTANAICFNHESPRRGANFVTRKITKGIAEIKARRASCITLGNMDAKRDWGHAKDYVRAMHLMLGMRSGSDYVIATGETRSVREFCTAAFTHAGMSNYTGYIKTDPTLFRPAEVDVLRGNFNKAKHDLGWKPEISFEKMVAEMVDADLAAAGVGK